MLNDARVKKATPNVRDGRPVLTKIAHAKGLYIEIRPNGDKHWRYRYRLWGKDEKKRDKLVEHIFDIGPYYDDKGPGHVTISQAERRRDEARVLVEQGIHPIERRKDEQKERQTRAANTFEVIGREWLERCRRGTGRKRAWTPKHSNHVHGDLERYVFPEIGSLPIRDVTVGTLSPCHRSDP